MPESNLFEIQAVDEDHSVTVEPTEWLKSLPISEQITKLRHYLTDLQAEYESVVDAMEQARISAIMAAARRYLNQLKG